MVKHMRFSYADVMRIPVFERRFYLDMWMKEMEKQKADYERSKSKK